MKGMTMMYDNRGKKTGALLALVSLAAMLVERFHGFIVFKKLDVSQHIGVFEWFMFFGLILIAFSREKYDDERAKMIRLKALQIGFLMQQSVTLGMAFTGSLHKDMKLEPSDLFTFAGLGIIFFLLFFHAGLYYDTFWEYEDKGLWYNFRNMGKHKWAILAYFVIAIAAMVLLFAVTSLN